MPATCPSAWAWCCALSCSHFLFSVSRLHFVSLSIRREQGVSGQPSSIMVEGVQVTLPSYEEAVYGSSGLSGASSPPPSPPPPPAPPESRVPIVLSEGLPQGATGGQGLSRTRHHRDLDFCLPSTSSSSSFSHRHAETVLVHQAPSSYSSSSSSSSSSWAREHPGGACAAPLPLRRDSESSDQHSLLSVTSTDEFSDGNRRQFVLLHTFIWSYHDFITRLYSKDFANNRVITTKICLKQINLLWHYGGQNNLKHFFLSISALNFHIVLLFA